MYKMKDPYWVYGSESYPFPGDDFNREIIEPGVDDTFPDGAVGVRVDGDFWTVAVLPFEKYHNTSIEDIVAEFWSDIEDPIFKPDSIE